MGLFRSSVVFNSAACSFFQTTRALELLGKFENIKGVQLYLNDKYDKVLLQYRKYVSYTITLFEFTIQSLIIPFPLASRDLDTCRKIYQKFKHDPPVQRNLPPVSECFN